MKARCQMDLRKFPLDSQICPLEIGSFGHDAGQMVYRYVDRYHGRNNWHLYWVKNCFAVPFFIIFHRWSKNPLSWDDREKMGLAQYHMVKWSHGNTLGTSRRTGNPLNMSSVFLEFTFQRRTGFYILQVYTPFKRFTIRKNILLLIVFLFSSRKNLLFVALNA